MKIVVMLLLFVLIGGGISVNAITFVNAYASVTGEVERVDGDSVYLDSSRFVIGVDTVILGEVPNVGDVITIHFALSGATAFSPVADGEGYYAPWGGSDEIFDMPTYSAAVVVNGDYDVYVGIFEDGVVRNRVRALADYEGGVRVDIDLADGSRVAVVSDGGGRRIFVLGEPFCCGRRLCLIVRLRVPSWSCMTVALR